MNTTQSCPQCGATLPADAPAGLCPACLLSAAAASANDPGATIRMAPPKPRELPHVGETFGGYRIERELGHGGMGAVYAAEHLESGRRVALKVLSHQLDSAEARARFLREGRLAGSINHPNSVYVFGTEEIEGTPVISMELIAGGTLQDRIQRGGAMPVGEAVDAVLQIIAGLEAAQAVGILHRDIKPANCFEDIGGTVKVGDFGLSISTQGRGDSLHTIEGTFLGTPAFCPPEQLRGEELNVRSDMYSVGVTLFYLLTGRTPFEGKNMVQLLANALEKPAPSPSQFRKDVPQSLSRVVLRCLEKLPAARFGSYEELRRALLPFTSTAPTPATLGLRFVAEMVDRVALIAMNWAVMFAFVPGFTDFSDPRVYRSEAMLWVSVGVFVLHLLYFGILEGVWGAGLGKAVVGLRVVRLNRGLPGIPRATARVLLLSWPTLLNLLAFKYDADAMNNQVWAWGGIALWSAFVLGMFSTARRHNGFAALHDLWTGTRVIQKAALQPRTTVATVEAPVATTDTMPRVGPYHVLGTLSTTEEQSLLLGYDTRLLRKVWIRQTRPGEPPVPPNLRSLARVGRLRWLQGERSAHASWDAYEAVSGKSLPELLTQRQPWQTVRHWLHDLAVELETAAKDGTTPPRLTPERVWIAADGRAKLLDFAPHGGPPDDEPPGNITPGTFLNQVALCALEGRPASAEEASQRAVAAPVPLSARSFLQGLADPSAGGLVEKLHPLLSEAASVAWWKRLAMVLVILLPVMLIALFMALGLIMFQRMQAAQPDFLPLFNCLMFHRDLEKGSRPTRNEKFNGAEVKAALEIHIAGRYGQVVRSPQWHSPFARNLFKDDLRATAERITAAHPQPTAEEMIRADAVVKPHIGTEDLRRLKDEPGEMTQIMGSVTLILMNWLLTSMAVLSLACTLLFRRGPMLRILGIGVVTDDGAEASRLRMLWRGFIAWSPVLGAALISKLALPRSFGPDDAPAPLLVLLLALLAVLAIASLAQKRSLQDQFAGTWLVPQ